MPVSNITRACRALVQIIEDKTTSFEGRIEAIRLLIQIKTDLRPQKREKKRVSLI